LNHRPCRFVKRSVKSGESKPKNPKPQAQGGATTPPRKQATMSDNLHAASSQWAERPADERFWDLATMKAACEASRDGSAVKRVKFGDLRASAELGSLAIVGPSGHPARLTHYAFGQLAGAVGAPAGYLRELPPETAATCLNVGLARQSEENRLDRDLLFHKNGALTLRACLSERYERVWDADVCAYLEGLTGQGWKNPAGRAPPGYRGKARPATEADILPGQINVHPGDAIAPSGLYASDHDMFAFLVAPDRVIGQGHDTMMRGVFVRNSEVGDSSLVFTFFLMQTVCGNHIVWGAKGVHEVRVRHTGANPMRKALREFEGELRRYRDGAAEEEKGIIAARSLKLGSNKGEVLDALVKYAKTHSIPLSRARLTEGYDTAADHSDWYGPPNTLWANVAGLTHASQQVGFADDRAVIDRAAGKLLEMANF
jgi:uncharacterized protein DUF932